MDRYTLIEALGEGAQGRAWKVRDPLSDEPRAVKLVEMGKASRVDRERLRREARALAQLRHPSLCRCHGRGRG